MIDDIPVPDEEEVEQIRRDVEKEQENWDPLDLPDSQKQLVKDIRAAGGPDEMVSKVGAGVYHDYVSPHPMPKHLLVADAKAHGLHEVAERVKLGRYDP
jgi:hypothetical protein